MPVNTLLTLALFGPSLNTKQGTGHGSEHWNSCNISRLSFRLVFFFTIKAGGLHTGWPLCSGGDVVLKPRKDDDQPTRPDHNPNFGRKHWALLYNTEYKYKVDPGPRAQCNICSDAMQWDSD